MNMDNNDTTTSQDRGFTLVELLIVIVILGVLAAVTVFAVRGITVEAEETTCDAEKRVLETAVIAYLFRNETSTIPASGASDGDEYERTLVTAQYLRAPTSRWNLQPDGALIPVGTPC
jgi:prepilin-type N-terminal cleavage/methylation domain-containing protein